MGGLGHYIKAVPPILGQPIVCWGREIGIGQWWPCPQQNVPGHYRVRHFLSAVGPKPETRSQSPARPQVSRNRSTTFWWRGVALDAADFFHLGLASKQDALPRRERDGAGGTANCLTYWLNQVAETIMMLIRVGAHSGLV